MGALDELEHAYERYRDDPAFVVELDAPAGGLRRSAHAAVPGWTALGTCRVPGLSEAGGPRPHRRPQDQQHPGADPAGRAYGQAAHHRRDRCRSARGGHGDRGRPLRARVPRLHGRGGHPPAGAQRHPHATPRCGGHAGHLRQRHPQGRHQRGHPRLGDQRGDHPLHHRVGGGSRSLSRSSSGTSRR